MKDDIQIILPVYNERDSIKIVVDEWATALKKQKLRYHILICEDGSTDGTKPLLQAMKKKYPLILNQKETRRGYGGAMMDGMNAAIAEYVLCADSDGQCSPRDFAAFWKNRDAADVIIGWRVNRMDSLSRKLFSFSFGVLQRLLFWHNLHDPSAPFVLFKPKKLRPYLPYLRYLREGFWWGLIATCVKKGLTVTELPIEHRLRIKGTSNVFQPAQIPKIAIRNIVGLFKLKLQK